MSDTLLSFVFAFLFILGLELAVRRRMIRQWQQKQDPPPVKHRFFSRGPFSGCWSSHPVWGVRHEFGFDWEFSVNSNVDFAWQRRFYIGGPRWYFTARFGKKRTECPY